MVEIVGHGCEGKDVACLSGIESRLPLCVCVCVCAGVREVMTFEPIISEQCMYPLYSLVVTGMMLLSAKYPLR